MNILKDSSMYQVLQKWGMEEGRKEETRKLLIRLGRIRFGLLPEGTCDAIEAIDELERLEHLSERLFTATSWADLLAETKRGRRIDAPGRRLRTRIDIEDSSLYRVILNEGIEKGRREGLKEGRIREAREILIRQGRIRFGRLIKVIRATLEAIDDLEELERLSERLLTAASWDDLLA